MLNFKMLNAKYKFKINKQAQECDRVVNSHTFPPHQTDALSGDASRIWTVVDSDAGYHLIPGFHYVNRVAHLESDAPAPSDLEPVRLSSRQFSYDHL